MTNLAEGRLIILADHALSRRKRVRRFWGTMGAVLRFEDRRHPRADNRAGDANATRTVRVDVRHGG